ncbi:hypothetical protein EVAR_60849_1 [Eumeta japonica]|uniref:Uncharacterized protein n=1 Tax=Eumeta variegata TaxID=151549 RepID=A0A4C1Y7G3_EUMVA|nr:hypothetical protein EVAR_60849_1 [Eumeta japonica]
MASAPSRYRRPHSGHVADVRRVPGIDRGRRRANERPSLVASAARRGANLWGRRRANPAFCVYAFQFRPLNIAINHVVGEERRRRFPFRRDWRTRAVDVAGGRRYRVRRRRTRCVYGRRERNRPSISGSASDL